MCLNCLVNKHSKTAGYSKREEAIWLPVLGETVTFPQESQEALLCLVPSCGREHTPRRGLGSHHWEPQVTNVAKWLHTLPQTHFIS